MSGRAEGLDGRGLAPVHEDRDDPAVVALGVEPGEEPPVGVEGGGTGASESDPGTPGGTQTTP